MMAAIVDLDMLRGSSRTNVFDQASSHGLAGSPTMSDASSPSLRFRASRASPRTNAPCPNPLPPFTFPVQAEKEPKNSEVPELPSFSFNPGASLAPPSPVRESTLLSPPRSPGGPGTPSSTSQRFCAHGHRRGGSEFVGGNLRSGEAITVTNSSPTKSESDMTSPVSTTLRPRRGHAHRRSAAISSHDLSFILLPTVEKARGSSAPASPSAIGRAGNEYIRPVLEKAVRSEPSRASTPDAGEKLNQLSGHVSAVTLHTPMKPPARNRVGFSDHVTYWTRPLSLVSSEASSTRTARPNGHSLSGSISSTVTTSHNDLETPSTVTCYSNPIVVNEPRPNTAGAVLERAHAQISPESNFTPASPQRRGSSPFLGTYAPLAPTTPNTPSPSKLMKRWSFFGLDPFAATSPVRSRPVSSSSEDKGTQATALAPTSTDNNLAASLKIRNKGALQSNKKRIKRQKKVKNWAGSIISRKSKSRSSKKRRMPTPTIFADDEADEFSELDEGPPEMATVAKPLTPTVLVTETAIDGGSDSWKAPRPASIPDEDTSYQMIDLDAALGPFNTPSLLDPEWEAAQRTGGLAKKQLHSAAGMTRFRGPGMHYQHRRAESAPEMVPFKADGHGITHYGSCSTMADVFEEDEEEDGFSGKTTRQSTPVTGPPVLEESGVADPPKEHLGAIGDVECTDPTASLVLEPEWVEDSKHPLKSCAEQRAGEEPSEREVAGTSDAKSNNQDTFAESPPRSVVRLPDLASADVAYSSLTTFSLLPNSPLSKVQSSTLPLPNTLSPFDEYCISKSPSSIAGDEFQSLMMGEPGPEVLRSSVEMLSTTSSTSNLTRETRFHYSQAENSPHLSQDAQQRPASFTATAFDRRRSSLASLSRLISSSHGERGQPSMADSMANVHDKKTKLSATKRLSRLARFWKQDSTKT